MSWQDLGVIFPVSQLSDWAASHAYVPTAIALDDRIRVFVAFWDANRTGRPGFIDVDPEDPRKILGYSPRPLIPDSEPGCFDCDGITPLSVVRDGTGLRLYYAGWRRLDTEARYTLFTGLAFSHDRGLSFQRHDRHPVIGPNTPGCTVRTGGVVLHDQGKWRCWYAEYQGQITVGDKTVPSYQLSTMDSADGIHWPDTSRMVFPVRPGHIFGYGRSAIWKEQGQYHGLFSIRHVDGGYRYMGYATSPDGYTWTEPGQEGMAFSAEDTLDGQKEVCFPGLIFQNGRIIMFYNGNDFGRAGLRAAIWNSRGI
ncbi:MAG: glucosyl hydrolase [Pseudomonadota bacterium]|nr:glucosyl hydrolase [Pseudomonadota bacterium]